MMYQAGAIAVGRSGSRCRHCACRIWGVIVLPDTET